MHRQAQVRQATLLDLMSIGKLAQRYADEVQAMKNHKLCLDTFFQSIAVSIVAPTGYVSVLVVDGEVRGAFWGCLTNMPWSAITFAQDICFFVDAECRGHGVRLIRDWVRWAKAQGAAEVCLSSASGIDTVRAQRLFEKQGFTKQGEAFTKELL